MVEAPAITAWKAPGAIFSTEREMASCRGALDRLAGIGYPCDMIRENARGETPKSRFGNFMSPGHTVSSARTLTCFTSAPYGEVGLAVIRPFADDAERYDVMGRDLGALAAYIRARARTRARSAA